MENRNRNKRHLSLQTVPLKTVTNGKPSEADLIITHKYLIINRPLLSSKILISSQRHQHYLYDREIVLASFLASLHSDPRLYTVSHVASIVNSCWRNKWNLYTLGHSYIVLMDSKVSIEDSFGQKQLKQVMQMKISHQRSPTKHSLSVGCKTRLSKKCKQIKSLQVWLLDRTILRHTYY